MKMASSSFSSNFFASFLLLLSFLPSSFSSSSLVRDDRRVRPLQKKMNNYFIFWLFNFLDVTFICNENEMNKEFRPFLNSKFVSFLPLETL